MSERVFLKQWKKECLKNIKAVHPDWDDDMILSKLDKVIDSKLQNPECALSNNYLNKMAKTTLLDLYDYIHMTKPILAAGGVLFKNQEAAINPPAIFLDGALTKRKTIKKGLKNAAPGSYEYMMIDLKQLTEKVVANSYYGASGNETSPFYNLYTALATTGCGQSLIATMMCAFEGLYSNNIKFYIMDDFLRYIREAINKSEVKEFIDIPDMPEVDDRELLKKIYSMFKDTGVLKDESNRKILLATLENLSKTDKKKVYYSNNLFEFIKIPSVERVLLRAIYTVDTFKDPNDTPKSIKDDLDYFWLLLQSWVVHNYPVFNRINRLKFEKRKVVIVIDTDSNMLTIKKWMDYLDEVIEPEKTVRNDENEIMYIKCNILCYILTLYSNVILANYAKLANIPDKYAPRLNMKNEFLYIRMILSNKKKSYCGIARLREGAELIPEKLDIKGMQFKKSTAAPQTKDYFENLTKEILYSNPISCSMVLKKVKAFARYIESSILSGEKTFLNPLAVKEPEAYSEPFSNQGIRGTYVWNLIYPDKQIQLPDKLTIAKVSLDKKESIERLQRENPDIYQKLADGIYDNPSCPFQKKGISVIAIPQQVELVPEWITPYILKDTIINDNITKFHMVAESLGVELMKSKSTDVHLTNIIKF